MTAATRDVADVILWITSCEFRTQSTCFEGAELDVSCLPVIGVLGVVYVPRRAVGTFAGARIAAWRLGLDANLCTFLGFALQAHRPPSPLALHSPLPVVTRNLHRWSTLVLALSPCLKWLDHRALAMRSPAQARVAWRASQMRRHSLPNCNGGAPIAAGDRQRRSPRVRPDGSPSLSRT
jgi:hypothetical protein